MKTKQKMASAEPQPRFGQSVKGLLSDRVGSCSGDVIALTRQVLKGSRSQEVKKVFTWFPICRVRSSSAQWSAQNATASSGSRELFVVFIWPSSADLSDKKKKKTPTNVAEWSKNKASTEALSRHCVACVSQLLGQAARNMVIQEDAILHSEDVSFPQQWPPWRVKSSLTVSPEGLVCSHCPWTHHHSLLCLPESEENVHHHHASAVPVSTRVVPGTDPTLSIEVN